MIGGTRSYGAGGYRDTPLEAALPVEMRVRNREKQPDVALVVVIDESGSMAACHCNTFDRNQAVQLVGRAQGRHRQGGDPARRGRPPGHRRAGRRRLQRAGQLGGQAHAARVDHRPPGEPRRDHRRRPDEHLRGPRRGREGPRGCEGDPAPPDPPDRRLVELRPVRRDPGPHEGCRHHALDGRRRRRREPVPRAAGGARRGPLLRRRQPVRHPRHLPQGDPAGLGPAARRGALLPGAHGLVADHPGPRRRVPVAPRLQRHHGEGGGHDRPRLRALRSGAGPVAVRPGAGGRLDVGRDRAGGRRAGSAGTASAASSASWSRGRSPARSPGASRPAS